MLAVTSLVAETRIEAGSWTRDYAFGSHPSVGLHIGEEIVLGARKGDGPNLCGLRLEGTRSRAYQLMELLDATRLGVDAEYRKMPLGHGSVRYSREGQLHVYKVLSENIKHYPSFRSRFAGRFTIPNAVAAQIIADLAAWRAQTPWTEIAEVGTSRVRSLTESLLAPRG